MTKYEWETELKRNIHSLPADEVKRVLEYYGELFEDMAERGKSEREIINDFGNPFDVACKILSEYDGDPQATDISIPAPTAAPSVTEPVAAPPPTPQCEVANPVSESSAGENAANSVTVQKVKSGGGIDLARLALFILFNVFTGGVVFILIGTVWIILASLVLSGAALVLSGGVAVISSFAVMGTGHAGAGFAQLGVSIAIAGLGILLAVGCVMLVMLYWKLNKLMFAGIRKFLTVKAV